MPLWIWAVPPLLLAVFFALYKWNRHSLAPSFVFTAFLFALAAILSELLYGGRMRHDVTFIFAHTGNDIGDCTKPAANIARIPFEPLRGTYRRRISFDVLLKMISCV